MDDENVVDIWADIRKLAQSFPLASVVKEGKRTNRKKPEGAGPYYCWTMKTAYGTGMRCRNRYCRNRIRSKQANIVCSEQCASALRDFCETTLAVLDGKMDARDYPTAYRTRYAPRAAGTRKAGRT